MQDPSKPTNSDCGHSNLYSYTDTDGKPNCLYCRVLAVEAVVIDLRQQLELWLICVSNWRKGN